jgi:transcriptional regulator with XRE-family HTH domain
MMDKSNINWNAMSDQAIMKSIGIFIKQQRLGQNKTQQQLALEAGINRATLSLFEKGESSNLATLIQLLRVLNCLQLLEIFQAKPQISPLQLAKLEQKERRRARAKNTKEKLKTDW